MAVSLLADTAPLTAQVRAYLSTISPLFTWLCLDSYSPLLLALGTTPEYEQRCFLVGNLETSSPILALVADAVKRFMPGIVIRSLMSVSSTTIFASCTSSSLWFRA